MTAPTTNPSTGSPVLAFGFATTVTMWAVAYFCRLPAVMAPAWFLLAMMLAAVVAWGWLAGRWAEGGWRIGLGAGVVAAVLNMLILGSLLSSGDAAGVVPSALWWVPGSALTVACLAAAAAAIGSSSGSRVEAHDWLAVLSKVAVAATFLLVIAGGLVTSSEAGLAVVDWPNTFGYNMFLYPLARMTGGIYYEHAHRLFGALVGLTTVTLAVTLWRSQRPRWVQRLSLVAVGLVILQGVLGGLRVTGNFTLSTSTEDMAPSIALAVTHGVLGQVFLGVIVVLAVATSRRFGSIEERVRRDSAAAEISLQAWLVAALVVQLVLGAVQRHLAFGLVIHISLAAVVATMALLAGVRAWALYRDLPPIERLGQLVMSLVTVQVALGIAALAVTQGQALVGNPGTLEVSLTTAHQACGAALLGITVALAAWTRRLLA